MYQDKSCTFVSTSKWLEPQGTINLKPSDTFLRTACHYFLTKYEVEPVVGTPSSTQTVGWYASNPDVPLYIPSFTM